MVVLNMSESKSYAKILLKKGVSGGVGFESEVCVTEGTSEATMSELIDKAAKAAKELTNKQF